MRDVKLYSFSVFAILAICAIVASTAQAGEFTMAKNTTKVDITNLDNGVRSIHKFVLKHGTIECDEVSGSLKVMEGTTAVSSITTEALAYQDSRTKEAGKCIGPPAANVPFEMNGCQLQLTAGVTIGTGGAETTSDETHIECTGTNKIKIPTAGCTIEIASQTIKGGHVVYKTVAGNPSTVTAEITLEKILYTQSGFVCTGGTGTFTDGKYTGNIVISGTDKNGLATAISMS